jgi:hypothetical protein
VFALFANILVKSPATFEILVRLSILVLSQTGKAFALEQPEVW